MSSPHRKYTEGIPVIIGDNHFGWLVRWLAAIQTLGVPFNEHFSLSRKETMLDICVIILAKKKKTGENSIKLSQKDCIFHNGANGKQKVNRGHKPQPNESYLTWSVGRQRVSFPQSNYDIIEWKEFLFALHPLFVIIIKKYILDWFVNDGYSLFAEDK